MLLSNQFFDEDFIALRNIDAGKSVERAARSNATDARRRFAPLLRQVAPEAQLAPYFHKMVLRPFERRLDGILLRMIGAQPRPQQPVNAFGIRVHWRGAAGNDAPPNAPSWNQIVFR